jgi:steroid delta-isomerase
MTSVEEAARAYALFFEHLTPEGIVQISELCVPEIRFRDPFNDVIGIEAYRRVLEKMFEDTVEPTFIVRDIALSGDTAYMRWEFQFKLKQGGADWYIDGVSEVCFDADGRVASHIDHWDSGRQFYEKLPILGALIRMVKRRLAA